MLVGRLVRSDSRIGFCGLLGVMGKRFHAVPSGLGSEGCEFGTPRDWIRFQIQLSQDEASFEFKVVITKFFGARDCQTKFLRGGVYLTRVGTRHSYSRGLNLRWQP